MRYNLILLIGYFLLIACNHKKDELIKHQIQRRVYGFDEQPNQYHSFQEVIQYREYYIINWGTGYLRAINRNTFQLDKAFTMLLQKERIFKICLWKGMLYGLDNKYNCYKLNNDTWSKCEKPSSLNIFDVVYEDEEYLMGRSCSGEFGSLLYMHHKPTHQTRGLVMTCSNSVVRKENTFIINGQTYHMSGYFSLFELNKNDIINFPLISDTLTWEHLLWDRDSSAIFVSEDTYKNLKYLNVPGWDNVMIQGVLNVNNHLYLISENKADEYSPLYLLKQNDSLWIPKDTLNWSRVEKIQSYQNNETIVSGLGFMSVIRNDSLITVIYQ